MDLFTEVEAQFSGTLDLPESKRSRRQRTQVDESLRVHPPVFLSVDECRAMVADSIDGYLTSERAVNRLLIKVDPGVGKSWAAIDAAHRLQVQGIKVVMFIPRHDFFDSMAEASAAMGYGAAYFHVWKPRTPQTERFEETCHLTEQIGVWMQKGHESTKFCSQVCGFPHMRDRCVYWAQVNNYKAKTQSLGVPPILVLQHVHLVYGHMMLKDMDVAIGDENPMGAFEASEFFVPAEFLTKALPDVPAKAFGAKLKAMAKNLAADAQLGGQALLDVLGGTDSVLEAISASVFPDDVKAPYIETALDTNRVGYNYLLSLCVLLRREAECSKRGNYNQRVLLSAKGLTLIKRNNVNPELPPRTIWLDGTADERLYREVTNWQLQTVTANAKIEGEIVQIVDSVFAKTSMLENKKPTPKAVQVARYVKHLAAKHGYKRPLFISYQHMASEFQGFDFAYFGGNRGSNQFQQCDACFVIGTPQPSAESIEYQARKLFHGRNQPFNPKWVETLVNYAGTDQGIPVSGMWNDSDLMTLLQQAREMEIVQSVHRVRPILSVKPIWLLTSLPVHQLPPNRLCTMLEAVNVDEIRGLSVFTFLDALDVASVNVIERGYCTSHDLQLMLSISRPQADKCLTALSQYDPDTFPMFKIRGVGRGNPPRAIGANIS